jgi:hypothetical protein
VYRSDAQPAVVQPLPRDPASTVPAYTAPARVEAQYVAAQPERRQRGWIETGFLAMTLPVAFTVGMMLAPVAAPLMWFFGSRRQP